MDKTLFENYKRFKEEAKIQTTSDSLRKRVKIILEEYNRLNKIILKDPIRLHDAEQKRILYFRQNGLCNECAKPMTFDTSTSHHVFAHSKGGGTDNLYNAVLVHGKCHERIEKKLKKSS